MSPKAESQSVKTRTSGPGEALPYLYVIMPCLFFMSFLELLSNTSWSPFSKNPFSKQEVFYTMVGIAVVCCLTLLVLISIRRRNKFQDNASGAKTANMFQAFGFFCSILSCSINGSLIKFDWLNKKCPSELSIGAATFFVLATSLLTIGLFIEAWSKENTQRNNPLKSVFHYRYGILLFCQFLGAVGIPCTMIEGSVTGSQQTHWNTAAKTLFMLGTISAIFLLGFGLFDLVCPHDNDNPTPMQSEKLLP